MVVKPMTDFTLQIHRRLSMIVPIEVPCRDGLRPPSVSPNGIDGRLDLCLVKVGSTGIASDGFEVLNNKIDQ